MKKKFLLLIIALLILLTLGFIYKKSLKTDTDTQADIREPQEKLVLPVDELEPQKSKVEEKNAQTKKTTIKTTKITNDNPTPDQIKENTEDKNIKTPEPKIEENIEKSHKETRSDVVNITETHTPVQNNGKIYYRGEFYNIKVRTFTTPEGEEKVQLIETNQIIKSDPDSQQQATYNEIKTVEKSKIETTMEKLQKQEAVLEQEMIRSLDSVQLETPIQKPVLRTSK